MWWYIHIAFRSCVLIESSLLLIMHMCRHGCMCQCLLGTCIHECMCAPIHKCMGPFINILMHACPCMYTLHHMHVHMHIWVHAWTHGCICGPMHVQTYLCATSQACLHVQMHVCVHVCWQMHVGHMHAPMTHEHTHAWCTHVWPHAHACMHNMSRYTAVGSISHCLWLNCGQ